MKDNKQPTAEAIRAEMIVKFLSIYSPCSPTDPDAIHLTSEEISLKLSPMVQASPTEISALLHTAGFETIYICGQWRWVLRILPVWAIRPDGNVMKTNHQEQS